MLRNACQKLAFSHSSPALNGENAVLTLENNQIEQINCNALEYLANMRDKVDLTSHLENTDCFFLVTFLCLPVQGINTSSR